MTPYERQAGSCEAEEEEKGELQAAAAAKAGGREEGTAGRTRANTTKAECHSSESVAQRKERGKAWRGDGSASATSSREERTLGTHPYWSESKP